MLHKGDEKVSELYKYRTIDKNSLDALHSRSVYFSFPSEFNDPFDCKANFSVDATDDDIRKWQIPHLQPESAKEKVFQELKNNIATRETIREALEKTEEKSVVLYCMSEVPDDILMWSHYADSHRGMCLGFRTHIHSSSLCIHFDDPKLARLGALSTGGFVPTVRVEYSKATPKPYNIFTGTSQDIKPFLTTKSKKWAYEKERRIIVPFSFVKDHRFQFSVTTLASVTFGCKTDDAAIQETLKIIDEDYRKAGNNVQIFCMKKSSQKYELSRELLVV